jgi:hypothetical protein
LKLAPSKFVVLPRDLDSNEGLKMGLTVGLENENVRYDYSNQVYGEY